MIPGSRVRLPRLRSGSVTQASVPLFVAIVVAVSSSSVIPWTVACQTPLSMGFSRQGYWSGLSFPSQGDLPDPGIEHMTPALAGGFFTTEPPGKPPLAQL